MSCAFTARADVVNPYIKLDKDKLSINKKNKIGDIPLSKLKIKSVKGNSPCPNIKDYLLKDETNEGNIITCGYFYQASYPLYCDNLESFGYDFDEPWMLRVWGYDGYKIDCFYKHRSGVTAPPPCKDIPSYTLDGIFSKFENYERGSVSITQTTPVYKSECTYTRKFAPCGNIDNYQLTSRDREMFKYYYGGDLGDLYINSAVDKCTYDKGFIVYPNPFNDHLTLKVPSVEGKTFNVVIYSTLGKVVFQQNINVEDASLNLDNLGKGTYILNIVDASGKKVHTRKIIKN